ncbi:MAG: DNA mismatch repair protein MutL, partial [Deltaproteobacteria bacterium CG_4_10_14_3_um_filter_60_8]
MSRIRILSENLANQIAAGEVVERPASVVKELVENAVDAGASRVEVWVEGNGTRLIRVLDDGCGMDADDVLLSLERHATSKLASQEDLVAILTLGFRGEALPAIASVARLTITSRLAGADLGMRAEIRFGRLEVAHEMGCPQGTAMEVQDLFGNVPARRKFLKSAATELAHIEEVVKACGLARPALGLRFMVNG